MKNLYKIIIAISILTTNLSFAQKGEVLITAQKAGNNIEIVFELLNEGDVSGLQFDIALPSSQAKSMSVSSCTASMGKSQLAGCSMNGNILRVAMIEQSLGEIPSGKIGSVTIKGANGIIDKKLVVTNVILSDRKGNEVNINAIVDYNRVSIGKPNDREFR